jgi:hypothetical protein
MTHTSMLSQFPTLENSAPDNSNDAHPIASVMLVNTGLVARSVAPSRNSNWSVEAPRTTVATPAVITTVETGAVSVRAPEAMVVAGVVITTVDALSAVRLVPPTAMLAAPLVTATADAVAVR